MLIIRNAQLRALARPAREHFIEEMLSHLYLHFPTQAWQLTRTELHDRVDELIDRAAGHQLTSRQQVCRFINLAASYGWTFDSDPELPWMRNILTDSGLTQPEERLDRLVNTCLHRQRVEAHNLAQRQALGLLPSSAPKVFEPQGVMDYSGLDSYSTTPPGRLESDEQIRPNPLNHHASRALWSAEESARDD